MSGLGPTAHLPREGDLFDQEGPVDIAGVPLAWDLTPSAWHPFWQESVEAAYRSTSGMVARWRSARALGGILPDRDVRGPLDGPNRAGEAARPLRDPEAVESALLEWWALAHLPDAENAFRQRFESDEALETLDGDITHPSRPVPLESDRGGAMTGGGAHGGNAPWSSLSPSARVLSTRADAGAEDRRWHDEAGDWLDALLERIAPAPELWRVFGPFLEALHPLDQVALLVRLLDMEKAVVSPKADGRPLDGGLERDLDRLRLPTPSGPVVAVGPEMAAGPRGDSAWGRGWWVQWQAAWRRMQTSGALQDLSVTGGGARRHQRFLYPMSRWEFHSLLRETAPRWPGRPISDWGLQAELLEGLVADEPQAWGPILEIVLTHKVLPTPLAPWVTLWALCNRLDLTTTQPQGRPSGGDAMSAPSESTVTVLQLLTSLALASEPPGTAPASASSSDEAAAVPGSGGPGSGSQTSSWIGLTAQVLGDFAVRSRGTGPSGASSSTRARAAATMAHAAPRGTDVADAVDANADVDVSSASSLAPTGEIWRLLAKPVVGAFADAARALPGISEGVTRWGDLELVGRSALCHAAHAGAPPMWWDALGQMLLAILEAVATSPRQVERTRWSRPHVLPWPGELVAAWVALDAQWAPTPVDPHGAAGPDLWARLDRVGLSPVLAALNAGTVPAVEWLARLLAAVPGPLLEAWPTSVWRGLLLSPDSSVRLWVIQRHPRLRLVGEEHGPSSP